jgi:hypothetical protein
VESKVGRAANFSPASKQREREDKEDRRRQREDKGQGGQTRTEGGQREDRGRTEGGQREDRGRTEGGQREDNLLWPDKNLSVESKVGREANFSPASKHSLHTLTVPSTPVMHRCW